MGREKFRDLLGDEESPVILEARQKDVGDQEEANDEVRMCCPRGNELERCKPKLETDDRPREDAKDEEGCHKGVPKGGVYGRIRIRVVPKGFEEVYHTKRDGTKSQLLPGKREP